MGRYRFAAVGLGRQAEDFVCVCVCVLEAVGTFATVPVLMLTSRPKVARGVCVCVVCRVCCDC